MNHFSFDWILILIGFTLGLYGIFLQIIVGGIASMFKISGNEGRVLVLSWVSFGAFISTLGFIPSVLIYKFTSQNEVIQFQLILMELSILLLIIHTIISGIKTHPQPVKIGFGILIIYFTMIGISFYV